MGNKKHKDLYIDYQGSENDQLIANLDTYLSAKRGRPEFALGIYGDWGIGKTFFIQDYLQRRGTDFCYVSLFGVSSTREIENKIFEYENPILTSPFARVGIGALLNLAKLNDDEKIKVKGTISSLADSIQQEANNFFARQKRVLNAGSKVVKKKSQPGLIVVDDLERCSLPTETVLGFLADLLQLRGYPVILIYNKREFDSKYSKQMESGKSSSKNCELDPQVAAQKEKVIGREIEFNPSVKSVLRDIYGGKGPVCRSLEFYERVLRRNGKNFRKFRQIVWNFELAIENVPETLKEFVIKWLDDLQKIYVATVLEMERSSSQVDIKAFLSRQPQGREGNDNFFSIYGEFLTPGTDVVIAWNLWDSVIKTGRFDWARVEDFINSQKQQPAAWRQLWEFAFTSQDIFEKSFQAVKQELEGSKLIPITVLFHELGLFYAMADQEFIGNDIRDEYVGKILSLLRSRYESAPEDFDFLRNDDLVMVSYNGFGLHAIEKVLPVLREYKTKAETNFISKSISHFSPLPSDYAQIKAEFLNLPSPVITRYCKEKFSAIEQFLNGGARAEDKIEFIEALVRKLDFGQNSPKVEVTEDPRHKFIQILIKSLDTPREPGFRRGSSLLIMKRLEKLKV